VKVTATWETELFGKLQASQEVTLDDPTPAPPEGPEGVPASQQDVTMPGTK
jgi:hypothetical protein